MSLTTLRVSLLAILCLTTLHSDARAQAAAQSEAPRAAVEGDVRRAEELYRDGEGLARRGDKRGALTALEEALKIYLRFYAESKPQGSPPTPGALATFRAAMARGLAHAPESVELYARLGGVEGATEFERGQLEALRAHALGFVESDASRAVFLTQEADVRATINDKPEPGYTEEARDKNVEGLVRLRAVLARDGEVKHILVLKGLPAGLTEKCVEAASRMKFTPAAKGGRPVSQFVVLEYNFSTF